MKHVHCVCVAILVEVLVVISTTSETALVSWLASWGKMASLFEFNRILYPLGALVVVFGGL